MKLSEYSIRHPAVVGILLAALFVGAVIAVTGLRQQLFAETELPQAIIITIYPGGSPEDVEREVSEPLEDALSTLDGVTEISSSSSESSSVVRVNFTLDSNVSERIVDIRELINSAMGELPDDIDGPPGIFIISTSALSAYTALVESRLPAAEVTEFLEQEVIPRISKVSGVAQASIIGAVHREVLIVLDPDRLNARGLSPLEITRIVGAFDQALPAGSVSLRGENLSVRSAGRYDDLEDLRGLVVGYQDGAPIRLRDVSASVGFADQDPLVIPITDGNESMTVSIDLVKDADTTEAISAVKAILAEIEAEKLGRIRFSTLNDDSEIIRLSLTSVLNSALMGGALAVLVLFLFLHNFRTTSIISVSIPLSLMIALMLMRLNGMTINMMTLVGLTIAIGMIVDASIVMLEHIHYHYHKGDGLDRVAASIRGAEEMSGPIVASTMTSLAVFLPLLFLQGMIGEVLRDVSLSLAFALGGSMLVALTAIPFLASRTLKARSDDKLAKLDQFFGFMERSIDWLGRNYRRLLEAALENRGFIITLAIALLVMSAMVTRFLGFDFIPATDMNEFNIAIDTPPGYSLEETADTARRIEAELLTLVPEVETAVYYAGQGGFFNLGGSSPGKIFAVIRLTRVVDRQRGIFEIMALLQDELPRRIPDVDITVKNGGFSKLLDASLGGAGFVLEVSGTDFDEVMLSADQVERVMAQDPNIVKVDRDIREGRRTLEIDFDHRLMGALGVNPYEVSLTNRIIFNGVQAASYGGAGAEAGDLPITVTSLYRDEVIDGDILNRVWVKNGAGALVPLRAFADIEEKASVSSIEHLDGLVTVKLSGQLREANLRETQSRVIAILERSEFPPGIEWRVGGSAAEFASAIEDLLLVLLVSIFLVYMVMVIQFERFIQPLIVMASVPFTIIGVVVSLLIFDSTLNIVSMLGIIALSGIVVNNAIVLIDYTNLLRRQGMELHQAVVAGAASRLKPILMTTMTTVLGIIPIALGLGEGGDILASLGQAIVGGLLTSTLITLVLIPVLYMIIETRREGREKSHAK
jgi:HAE1 family hydrophobic/amphiphilic exporter-1